MKTAKEFYEFFQLIPENRWGMDKYVNPYTGQCCAAGLLGVTDIGWSVEGHNLEHLFQKYLNECVAIVNDKGPAATPKENILEALQVVAELGG